MAERRSAQSDGTKVAGGTGGLHGLRWKRLGYRVVAVLGAGFPWTIWYSIYSLGGPAQWIAISPPFLGPIAGYSIVLAAAACFGYWSFAGNRMPELTAVGLRLASRNLFSRRTVREIRWADVVSLEIGFQSTPAAPPAYRQQFATMRIALKDGRRLKVVLTRPGGAPGRRLEELVTSAKESWMAFGLVEGASHQVVS